MHLYYFLGYNLCEHHIRSYLVHIVIESLIHSFSSAGELGTIFISPKFHYEAFNSFSLIFYSLYRIFVIALLNFYVISFFYDCLIVLHVLFFVIHFILVASYLISLFYPFIIVSFNIIIYCYVSLAVDILISRGFIA